jgi:hypothetical protein
MPHTEQCNPDSIILVCPFCGRTVDEDTRVCETCHAGVDPVRFCTDCEEPVGTLGEYEQTIRNAQALAHALADALTTYGQANGAHMQDVRDVPRHVHTWVIDGTYTDTPDTRERCTTCHATRDQMPHEQMAEEPAQ